jgi:hypothetical protein
MRDFYDHVREASDDEIGRILERVFDLTIEAGFTAADAIQAREDIRQQCAALRNPRMVN